MSARVRILRNLGIGLAIVMVACVIAAVLTVRTDRFRQFVKQTVVTAAEDGTGGRVEIGSFAFDWTHLHAAFTDFVIHGNEPPGAAPYLRARRIDLCFRLFPMNITDLDVDHPEANILVAPDGSTNVPEPKHPSTSKKTPLETIVDLAVGHFDLANGSVNFNSRKQNFDLHGDNLHVQLWYDLLKQGYRGNLSFSPVYRAAGSNRPVNLQITLPVVLERDRIEIQNGSIATNASALSIDGSIEHLRNPRATAHIRGRVALAEIAPQAHPVPAAADLDLNATVADNLIDVADSRIVLGQSFLEASGKLRDPTGLGRLQFHCRLALGELGRLARLAERPEGTAQISGTATLDANRDYDVRADAVASGVSFQQGAPRIAGVSLMTPIHLTPRRLELTGFHVRALGAEMLGDATLQDLARYTVEANLRRLDLRTLARDLGQKLPGYDGTVSGLLGAAGDLTVAGAGALTAHARLAIAPGRQGVPVSGRLNLDYRGSSGNLALTQSYLALPHSRLTLNGSLNQHLDVTLATRNLADFSPLTSAPLPVVLSGQAAFNGTVTGRLASPQIAGHLSVNRFAVEGRSFDALEAGVAASPSRAAVSAGSLRRGAMQAQFNAAVGLRNWDATPDQPLTAQASIRNADLADLVALAGVSPNGYSGALNADASVAGTVANPRGSANLTMASGAIRGEPVDSLQAQAGFSDQLVTLSNAHVVMGPSRIDLSAEFRHPRERLNRGQLHAHIQTTSLDLARLHTVQSWRPGTAGSVQTTADVTGELRDSTVPGTPPEFLPSQITLDSSGHGLQAGNRSYGDFTASASTRNQTVSYTVRSNFAGTEIRVDGGTQLAPGYRTNADASITGLPIQRVLFLAPQQIPVSGTLTATAHFAGTLHDPEGSLDATVDHAVFYDEPIDRAALRADYRAAAIDVPRLELRAGPSNLELAARFDHPAGTLQSGNLQFRIQSGHVDLARVRHVQNLRPGLTGTIQLTGSGAAVVRPSEPRVLARDLNLNLAARGIAPQGKNFGDLTLTAASSGGSVQLALDSDLAGAAIHGRGTAQLGGNYPVQAQMTFQNVAWKRLQPLLGVSSGQSPDFDAALDGQVTVNGPALRTHDLSGRLQLSRLQLSAAPPARSGGQPLDIENQGPVALAMDHGVVRIESFRLAGSGTSLEAGGSVSLHAHTMDAKVSAHANLALLQHISRDVDSSGEITADATLHGTFQTPLIIGKAELHQASVNDINFPMGISNANGVIQFNGNSATLRDVGAEMGGGKLTLAGLVAFSAPRRFVLHANARNVRMLVQPGVSAVADADLRLDGRPVASVLSGTVTIDRITYAPQSDFASILSRAAPPVQPQTPSPILDSMKLDVQVRTSSATAVQASLAENVQADANLHVQGTASQPSVLGRVNITEGKLLFFSSSYTVNSGSISFYNPVRIDPILDMSLETQASGVDVVLHVTGPVDNMKLSYTSNPPLPFQEIVGLLAAGQVPTSDPTLLANQPVQPPQTFQEMGESAVLSQTLADPVANRLQRVFGITQLRIAPSFNSGSDLPQAQVALQQKVTDRVTLTYITGVDNSSSQIISGAWTFSREWSATATRDQNGLFSIEFLYKRQLR